MALDSSLDARLAAADAAYTACAWDAARPHLAHVLAADRAWATLHSVPLMLDHCRIELASPDALEALAFEHAVPRRTERETTLTQRLRFRTLALARSGDHQRAAKLLRLVADYDGPIADALVSAAMPRSTAARTTAPGFVDDPTLSPASVAAHRQRFAAARLLLIYRRLFIDNPQRAHDPVDCLARSAERFGLTVRVIDAYRLPAGIALGDYAGWLQAQILDFRPDVVVYDDLFESGVSAADATVVEQIATVLEGVRTLLGVRVVKSLLDAWLMQENGAERPMKGMGTYVDLLQHMHPALHAAQSPGERARSFCYLVPFALPRPTVPPGTIARAGFVGSISWFNIARLVWWVEAGKRGIPFDFHESDHTAAVLRSDQDYANLLHQYQVSVNFTRRSNGSRILTARTIETLLCEGVLAEEASDNTAYFLAPGSHYEPFTTIDEFAGLVDDLLRSEARRRRLSREGHQWVQAYFSGDRFWAGLFARLFD